MFSRPQKHICVAHDDLEKSAAFFFPRKKITVRALGLYICYVYFADLILSASDAKELKSIFENYLQSKAYSLAAQRYMASTYHRMSLRFKQEIRRDIRLVRMEQMSSFQMSGVM